MERQFTEEIKALKLGAGETFHGEGILAVTKALLQAGVSYVGGYQGAPVSHLLDVMVQAREYMDDLGVHVEACASEAAAAAMLGASINYPARGAVTWKSIVGTNVAADALSYLASAGVMGGTLIVLGEDYGEGGVVAQERSHAFALKSLMWLLDPRPNLSTIVDLVENYARQIGVRDIDIRYTGLRPGEKLHESLFADHEACATTTHPRIFSTSSAASDPGFVAHLERLFEASSRNSVDEVTSIMAAMLRNYVRSNHIDEGANSAPYPDDF